MRVEHAAPNRYAAEYSEFFAAVQPRLRHALAAALGSEVGIEAAQEAMAWGWEHWAELREMDNPAGYLYRVGRSRSRRFRFRRPPAGLPPVQKSNQLPWVEPGLPKALERLSERQRIVVVLVYSMGWTFAEAAEMLGVSIGTVQTHAERGLVRLRRALGGAA